jgi:hypothetical protein
VKTISALNRNDGDFQNPAHWRYPFEGVLRRSWDERWHAIYSGGYIRVTTEEANQIMNGVFSSYWAAKSQKVVGKLGEEKMKTKIEKFKILPCRNCGEKPSWKSGKLIHNQPTCPNRWDIALGAKKKSVDFWNNYSSSKI